MDLIFHRYILDKLVQLATPYTKQQKLYGQEKNIKVQEFIGEEPEACPRMDFIGFDF